jgi:hypothetical protein
MELWDVEDNLVNQLKEKEQRIKELEAKIDWYKQEFGKWEDGDEVESIVRGRKIDREENQRLREALEEIVNGTKIYSFKLIQQIAQKALEKYEYSQETS